MAQDKLLLTDEEIKVANQIPPGEYAAKPNWWLRISSNVAKAQLTKAEPLIRENERERIFSKLEREEARHWQGISLNDQIDGREPREMITLEMSVLRWQALREGG